LPMDIALPPSNGFLVRNVGRKILSTSPAQGVPVNADVFVDACYAHARPGSWD
jgi:hypothetical protein